MQRSAHTLVAFRPLRGRRGVSRPKVWSHTNRTELFLNAATRVSPRCLAGCTVGTFCAALGRRMRVHFPNIATYSPSCFCYSRCDICHEDGTQPRDCPAPRPVLLHFTSALTESFNHRFVPAAMHSTIKATWSPPERYPNELPRIPNEYQPPTEPNLPLEVLCRGIPPGTMQPVGPFPLLHFRFMI